MLEAAGVGAVEERVYRFLVGVREADAAGISAQLGLDVARVHWLLASLHDKGLVGRVAEPPEGGPERYVAMAPDAALRPLLLRGHEALEWARRGVEQLAEEYRAGGRRHDAGQLVEVITGASVIRQRLRQMAYGAGEMRWLCKARPVALAAAENDEEWELLARGVRYRTIYERELLEGPGMVDNVARSIRAGEQARAVGTLPVRLVIADSSMAICPLVYESGEDGDPVGGAGPADRVGEPTAAVVHSSSLLDALIALFESQWAAATPLHVTDSGELADVDGGGPRPAVHLADDERYLLSLIVAGVADKAIASQLWVSQRTVQRRIQALMQRAGALTRTQLVWQAAQRGWLA
ncbi:MULTISPECIES: LuxR family transcriptional regulator [unclassified Streptomyces]|uniref:helix-turn-helix transcriptional regulator n=1 Tax=unclassified Streptomyces TaxID=2593676 RepID=UPI0006FFB4D2|nr:MULTISPECIES: LuxR family transcriptional regulator [unclassified Streptomyces]KQX57999.1 TrmB family transcriptional regulator [Streptomyces sp. Root1304]KRA95417.1 TrmB family transcriptional regulator [Streptomyces sp. Root66D1]